MDCDPRVIPKNRRYIHRLRDRLEAQLGGKCRDCGVTYGLEFAHTEPTDCTGRGRGSYERLRDVRNNPEKYTLLCQPCHEAFDGPMYMSPHFKKKKGSRS
jgi:5-methylcytosine-specific restriction endonuclease McrA